MISYILALFTRNQKQMNFIRETNYELEYFAPAVATQSAVGIRF